MLAREKIIKAMESLELALNNLDNDQKRLTVGDLDFAEDKIKAAKYVLISEIIEEDGKL
jgi:hypothetical protein